MGRERGSEACVEAFVPVEAVGCVAGGAFGTCMHDVREQAGPEPKGTPVFTKSNIHGHDNAENAGAGGKKGVGVDTAAFSC